MLIIGFGVTEALLSTLVFTCETCGNHAAHQLTKQTRKFSFFFLPLFSVGTKCLDSYRMWPDHRGQQGAGGDSGPAGRPGPAVIRLRCSPQLRAGWPRARRELESPISM
jgi:hypothetical protein